MTRTDGWSVPGRGELRREALVRAGVDLLLEKGWASITVRAVARGAGQAPSAVSYYFGGLWRLRHEVVDTVLDELFEPVLDELVRHRSWPLGLAAVVRLHHDPDPFYDDRGVDPAAAVVEVDHYAQVEVDRHRVLAELLAASLEDVLVRQQVRMAVDDARARLVPWLESTGVPREHAFATAAVVVAAVDGLLLHSRLGEDVHLLRVAAALEHAAG